jgi:hypothetical protein
VEAYQKRKLIYFVGLSLTVFVIVSVLVDAKWVFRVFLAMKNQKISLDTNNDGRDDYFETWEKGELVLSQWDMNSDGRIDYRNYFSQDKLIEVEWDSDFDGYFEYREVRRMNGAYRVEIDEDKNGVFEVKTQVDQETLPPVK